VGIIDIRHRLNDELRRYFGHIGYGVRPSERNKGYATEMLGHGLVKCKKMGLARVMLACYQSNTASARTILRHGGHLEREVIHPDGRKISIYWIELREY
jgi:predicted acetyltransferase